MLSTLIVIVQSPSFNASICPSSVTIAIESSELFQEKDSPSYSRESLSPPASVYSFSIALLWVSSSLGWIETYTIRIKKNNESVFTDTISLKDKENIQFPYYMDQTKNKGINQTLNLELYKNDDENPYRTLLLRYNVV